MNIMVVYLLSPSFVLSICVLAISARQSFGLVSAAPVPRDGDGRRPPRRERAAGQDQAARFAGGLLFHSAKCTAYDNLSLGSVHYKFQFWNPNC
jgi:hypothetical protein